MGVSQSREEVLDPISSELVLFCQENSNSALQSAEVDVTNSEIKIDLDDKCCELVVRADKNLNEEYVIEICLEYLRIHRSEGCRSGNEYLEAINVLLDGFFVTLTSLLKPLPIRRVFFKVKLDVASIPGFSSTRFSDSMLEETKDVDLDITLSELIGSKRLTVFQNPDVVDFYEKVLRLDFPSIYHGSIRVSELAHLIYTWSRSGEAANVVRNLLCKLWYDEIFPSITTRVETDEQDSFSTIYFSPINLGLVTLLTRDDAKTWYMNKLHLSLCDNTYGVRSSNEFETKIRAHQNTPITDFVKPRQKYFPNETRTVREVLFDIMTRLRANRRMTYYDAFVYQMINDKKYDDLNSYFENVCRDIYKAY